MSHLLFRDQKSFMRYFGQEPSEDAASLYAKLCAEEFGELTAAWCEHQTAPSAETVTEIADACLDLIYVASGLMHALGLDPQPLWDEVHRSNIEKIKHPCLACDTRGILGASVCSICGGQGHQYEVRRRDDGKVLKPANWQPPSLLPYVEAMLRDQA